MNMIAGPCFFMPFYLTCGESKSFLLDTDNVRRKQAFLTAWLPSGNLIYLFVSGWSPFNAEIHTKNIDPPCAIAYCQLFFNV